jgi:hypothetical protein
MGTRWSVVLMTAGVLAVASVSVSCAALTSGGGEPIAAGHKIKIEYNAKGTNQTDRIKVKKDNGNAADEFNRCTATTDPPCKFGHPVRADGSPVLGTITASDGDPRDRNEVFFVSDATSPGSTCVCYGNKCYCN